MSGEHGRAGRYRTGDSGAGSGRTGPRRVGGDGAGRAGSGGAGGGGRSPCPWRRRPGASGRGRGRGRLGDGQRHSANREVAARLVPLRLVVKGAKPARRRRAPIGGRGAGAGPGPPTCRTWGRGAAGSGTGSGAARFAGRDLREALMRERRRSLTW